jgi:hypothetical protein
MARRNNMRWSLAWPSSGKGPGDFPLSCEQAAAQGQENRPAYQKCKTGTRYWRAEVAKSVRGDWRVYVYVLGPRGTEHGWYSYTPDHAYRAAGEIVTAVDGLTEDIPLVLAPWRAVVKGKDEYFTLTAEEARVLAARLCRLARAAEARQAGKSPSYYDDAARDGIALVEASAAGIRAHREGDHAAVRRARSDADVLLSHGHMRNTATVLATWLGVGA